MKDKSILRSLLVASATAASVAHGENVLCIKDPNPSAAGTYSAWYRTTSYAFEDKISNAVTLAIWVKDMNAQYEKFIAGVNERWNLAIPHTADSTNRKLVFRTEFGLAVGSGYVLNDGKWHFLVGTFNYDSSDPSLCSQRLYVDGVLAAEKTEGLGAFSTPAKEFSLGAKAAGFGAHADWRQDVNGSFAELSVWDRALSAAEVQALHGRTTRLDGNESGLVAYWPLTGDVGMADADFSFPNAAASTGVKDLSRAAGTGLVASDDDFALPYVRCVASPEWCAAKGYVQTAGATGRSWADPLTNLVAAVAAAKPFERILCSPGTHRIESEMSPLVNHFHLGSQDSDTMEPCPNTAVIDAGGKCRHFRCTSDVSAHMSGFLLENLTFANGRASDGGSIYTKSRTGKILNCVFEDNAATNGNGGAFYSYTAAGSVISNCVFRRNNATGIGGAAYTQQSGESEGNRQNFIGCVFSNNVAQVGGGIGAERCVLIDGCRFADNVATNGTTPGNCRGGNAHVGIYSRILNCEFTGKCMALGYGSCLNMEKADCLVSNSVFRGMEASGGYAMFHVRSGVSFVNCVITNNNNTDRIFFPDVGKNLLVRQCLIAGNTANQGVVWDWNSSSRFENCTILQQTFSVNQTGYGTNTLVNCILPNANVTSSGKFANILTNCLVKSVSGGTQDSGVMTGDPKFADAANGDYLLAFNSPCREKGILLDWMTADATDLAGAPRLVNLLGKAAAADALPDLGCYECQERGELPTMIYMR